MRVKIFGRLAALIGLAADAPRIINTPLKEAPSRRFVHKKDRRRARRKRLSLTFSRAVLGHLVMREPFVPNPKAAPAVNEAMRGTYYRRWRNERRKRSAA